MMFERQPYFGFEIPRAHMLLWEDHSMEIYKNRGREARLIQNPTHLAIRDRAMALRAASLAALAERLGLPANVRVVAIFPAYYADVAGHGTEYQRRLEDALCEIVKGVAAPCHVVIKVHPNENFEYWERVFQHVHRPGITLVHSVDRFALMALSDCLVSTNSYAAVEASMTGCATINFVLDPEHIGREFCASFGRHSAFEAASVEEVLDIINGAREARTEYASQVRAAQDRILGEPGTRPSVEQVMDEILTVGGAPDTAKLTTRHLDRPVVGG